MAKIAQLQWSANQRENSARWKVSFSLKWIMYFLILWINKSAEFNINSNGTVVLEPYKMRDGAIIKRFIVRNEDRMKNGRELFGATSASQSTISGAGVQSFTAFTTNQVKVTAKDSSGVSRGIGNDVFWIRIENQCTKGTSFECIDVSSQRKVLQTEISQKMYDNLDGTYTYSYSSNLDGTITVYVFFVY